MCEPIVERRRTLAQLDMNAETAATPQREIMMLILWTSFFKMKLTLKLKVRMIDGFIVALLLLSFCKATPIKWLVSGQPPASKFDHLLIIYCACSVVK